MRTMGRCSIGGGWWRRSRATCRCGGGGWGRLVKAGDGSGGRLTTARGVWLQCIFVERQVGGSPFGSKKRSTELMSMIPTQKSKDASRMQHPPFASYLRPSEGQNLKDASRTKEKTQKKSPNTPSDGRNLRPYALNPLYCRIPEYSGIQTCYKLC